MNSLIVRLATAVIFSAAVGLSPSAQEYEPATTTYPAADPDGEILNTLQPETEAAKSVNVHLHNGEFFIEQTDLTIAGRGFDFQWKRTYRSRANVNGPFGHNWDHSYNIYVEQDGADLILHDGDFREDRFEPTSVANTWASFGQFRTIYFKGANTPSDPSDDRYVVVLRHNSKWILNPLNGDTDEGKCRSIIDRNGNVMLLEYDGRTGDLKRIKDTLHENGTNERIIDIRYNASGYISEIEDFCTDLGVGGAGRKVTYTYWTGALFDGGEAGDLRSVTSPVVVGTSTGNDFPTGKTWNYEYTTGSSNAQLKHNLTAVLDPKGQLVVGNSYYSGAPASYVFDRVVRQKVGAISGPQFNYWYEAQTPSAANNNANHVTIVNDRMGNVSELYYDNQALALIREFSGRAPDPKVITTFAPSNRPTGQLRASDPVMWETRVTLNRDGLLEEIESPNGEVETYCYDSDDPEPRSRGNLIGLAVTPGVGMSADDDFSGLNESWSFISLFNKRAMESDFRGLIGELTYDGDGVDGGFKSCASQSALTAKPEFQVLPIAARSQSVETISLVADMEPDPNIVYSAPADQSNGDSGESGGEEPNSTGGGGCAGESCPEEMTSSSLLALTACNCYVYGRNDAGQLTMEVDPEGRTTSYVYYDTPPMHGYLEQVITDAGGESLTEAYTYNLAGHVTSYMNPRGLTTTYEVNALGQVVSETGPAPSSIEKRYFYDANDNLIQVDIENVESLVTGDAVVTDNPWITTTYSYDTLNNRTSETHEVDTLCQTANVVAMEYQYDDNENLSLVKNGESVNGNQPGNTVSYVWDERDLLFKKTMAPGLSTASTTQFDYDDNRNLIRKSVGIEMPTEERVFAYEFNGYDRLKKVTDPMGNTLELEYDEAGNVTKRSWNGDLTDDSTDGLSNVLLREISYVWDERERMTDEAHSFFKYDGSMTPTVATFNKEYNGVNQVSATIDAESNRVDILRDTAHRIEQVEFPLFNRTEILQIDANGNSLESRDTDTSSLPSTPSAHYATTNNLYDELDRLDQSTDNAGNITKYGYDSRGNLIQTIDANMVERRYLYDGLNRLIVSAIDMDGDGALISVDSMTCDLVVDPDDIVTTQVWDDSSRLIAQIDDSGNDTRYAFDEHNRQIVRRMADGTLHQIGFGATWASGSSVPDLSNFQTGYDLQGNLVQSLDANGTTLMCTYDKNNRLTSREAFPVSSDIKGVTLETYSYDGLGRVIKAENDDCIVNRTYDSMGNLIVEEIDIDKTAMISGPETKRTYDKVGNATTLEYPSGRIINTSYDEFNRKKTITEGSDSETFHYLGRNILEARILGTGAIGSYSGFDYSLGAVRTPKTIGHQVVGGAFLSLNSLTWDGVGNKLTKQGGLTGATKHEYQYDDAYRLVDTTVSEVSPSNELRHTEYDLDGVHNRNSVTETLLAGTPDFMAYTLNPGAPDYDLELNQYSVTPADARVYDANGNWIEKRDPAAPTNLIATIYYDAFNRMVEYQEFGGAKHSYKYDCFGRRVAKVIDDGGVAEKETRFFYGERDNWHVIEERDAQGAPTAT